MKVFRTIAAIGALALLATVAPAHAAEPFGSTACNGVRPGAWIEAPRGTIYTMGFLLKGSDKANYITTVGNFVLATFGTKTWPSAGPRAYDANGKVIGRFVYAVHTNTPAYTSFGLVRLDGKVIPSAQVCHFGGPTGMYRGDDVAPITVGYYGNGFPLDAVSPARTATVTGTANENNAFAQGALSLVDSGDYGAPFVADGKALGYWDGGVGLGGGGAGLIVARLAPWMAKAQKALKLKLALVTARAL